VVSRVLKVQTELRGELVSGLARAKAGADGAQRGGEPAGTRGDPRGNRVQRVYGPHDVVLSRRYQHRGGGGGGGSGVIVYLGVVAQVEIEIKV